MLTRWADSPLEGDTLASLEHIHRFFAAGSASSTNSETFFHLKLKVGVASSGDASSRSVQCRQLVLRAPSGHAAGLYRRLMTRCLRIAVSAPSDVNTDLLDNDCDVKDNDCCRKEKVCVVPGAGAAEMLWSVMWGSASSYIEAAAINSSTTLLTTDSMSSIEHLGAWLGFKLSVAVVGSSISQEDESLCGGASHRLLHCRFSDTAPTICQGCRQFVSKYLMDHSGMLSILRECQTICRMIATSYEIPPRQLLNSQIQAAPSAPACGTSQLFAILRRWRDLYKTKTLFNSCDSSIHAVGLKFDGNCSRYYYVFEECCRSSPLFFHILCCFAFNIQQMARWRF